MPTSVASIRRRQVRPVGRSERSGKGSVVRRTTRQPAGAHGTATENPRKVDLMWHTFLSRLSVGSTVVLSAVALAAPAASAAPWTFGGNEGRAGIQVAEPGGTPLAAVPGYADLASPNAVETSPLITSGTLSQQRIVYGTADGKLRVRRLDTGAAVGSPIDLLAALPGDPPETRETLDPPALFGGLDSFYAPPVLGAGAAVEATNGDGPGQVYVLLNDPVTNRHDQQPRHRRRPDRSGDRDPGGSGPPRRHGRVRRLERAAPHPAGRIGQPVAHLHGRRQPRRA